MAGDLPSDVFSGCWPSRAVMAKSLPPMASEKRHFNVHLTCDWSDSLHNQSTRHLLTSTLKMKTFQITPGERDDVSRRNIHSTARFFVFPPNTVEKSRSAASGMGKGLLSQYVSVEVKCRCVSLITVIIFACAEHCPSCSIMEGKKNMEIEKIAHFSSSFCEN